MSIGFLLLTVFNIFMGLGIAILWIRQTRPPKEDPRLSRGLQLLQSKIAVLEDLSDRTETQVKQLTQILDERAKHLQTKMLQAQETVLKIEQSMHKSLEVAEIFQDKIPHEEIVERNQQSKYVRAAQLAFEGKSIDEITADVDLPRSEVELIAKVNREQLTFDPTLLPEWAKSRDKVSTQDAMEARMVDSVFQTPVPDLSALHRIEEDFKRTVREVEEIEHQEAERIRIAEERARLMKQQAVQATQNFVSSAGEIAGGIAKVSGNVIRQTGDAIKQTAKQTAAQAGPVIRKVQFPKIFVEK
jgi:hypothetical protein